MMVFVRTTYVELYNNGHPSSPSGVEYRITYHMAYRGRGHWENLPRPWIVHEPIRR